MQREQYTESTIYALERNCNLIITRKRDGWKLYALKDKRNVRIYTDGILDVTAKAAHLAEVLASLMPPRSLIMGEGIYEKNGRDVFNKVAGNWNRLSLAVFDVIFWKGAYQLDTRFAYRRDIVTNSFSHASVFPVAHINESFDYAKQLVKENEWEGLVLSTKDFTSSFRTDGKSPKRHSGCYKWKPRREDDFFVKEWILNENDPGKLKEVVLLQKDPLTGKEIDCGKHGTFDAKTRIYIQKCLEYGKLVVLQMGFEMRFPSGKLRNKYFIRLREDKKAEDCLAPDNKKSA